MPRFEVSLRLRLKIPRRSLKHWLPKKHLAITLILVALLFPTQIELFPSSITTQAGEWGEFRLPDGSTVDLGPNSKIKVLFDADGRMVVHVRGEAVYAVTPDPLMPFSVETGNAIVTAVGTRFGIDHDGSRTVVTMSDGKVDVVRPSRAWDRGTGGETVRVIKGQQVVVEAGRAMVPSSVDVEASLAWRDRRVIFTRTPVADAIAEFNRRNVIQLQPLSDPEALTLNVSGTFRLDDPVGFEHYLKEELRRRKGQRRTTDRPPV